MKERPAQPGPRPNEAETTTRHRQRRLFPDGVRQVYIQDDPERVSYDVIVVRQDGALVACRTTQRVKQQLRCTDAVLQEEQRVVCVQ